MRASILQAPMKSKVEELPIPPVKPDEVLIRVEACGVCASEVHRWERGTPELPQRLGHEPAGVVEEVGEEVDSLKPGDRVAAFASGKGAFAEYVVVDEKDAIPFGRHVPFEAALAEPLGCLVSGLERTPIHIGDRAAVIGCGFMGLVLIQLLRLRGAVEITAVDIREDALVKASEMGAGRTCRPDKLTEADQVTQWSQIGQGFDAVFETTGAQKALNLAGDITAVHGVLSIVGWHQDGIRSVNVGLWNWKALTVINAHERRRETILASMRAGMAVVEAGLIDVETLVTHRYRLSEVDKAFREFQAKPPGFTKAVVFPQWL